MVRACSAADRMINVRETGKTTKGGKINNGEP
jgi:hypothetical protein